MKLNNLIVGTLLAAMTVSCSSLKKMSENSSDINFNITPEILETHAGEIKVEATGNIPSKYFGKKVSLEVTPTFIAEGVEKEYKSFVLQGEKVNGNGTVISKDGGQFSYTGSIPYSEDLNNGELFLNITGTEGSKTKEFEIISIAPGTIITSTRYDSNSGTIIASQKEENTTGEYNPTIDSFQRVIEEEYSTDLMYLINSSTVRGSEKNKDKFKMFSSDVAFIVSEDEFELDKVVVSAYASPDGKTELNEKLSQNREKSAKSTVDSDLKKVKVIANIISKYTPEDWDGFQKLMAESDIKDKELILRVLSMYKDPEVREREIKNLASTYTAVADQILPQLRRAKVSAIYKKIGKEDKEILSIAESNPANLKQDELLHAAALTDDLNRKMAIYMSFTKEFPNDWRGFNNIAAISIARNDINTAEAVLAKADALSQGNAIVQNNMALAAFNKGEIDDAKILFSAASGKEAQANKNLGLIAIAEGDYKLAEKIYEDCSCSNSILASILNENYSKATAKIAAADQDSPMVNYLKAVLAARTGDKDAVIEGLSVAISKDSSLKEVASADLEFAKYILDTEFRKLTK